jgi:hypothetical protein
MLHPTSLKDGWGYPVTVSMAAGAAAVSAYWRSGWEINGFFMDGQVWANWQLWRGSPLRCPLSLCFLWRLISIGHECSAREVRGNRIAAAT